MKNGWIKISRNITSHWLWQDAERLKWWLDLLFMASWEDKEVLHDAHKFTLHRGQMIASISFLAERWGRNNNTIIKYLKLLEAENMIIRKVLHRQTAIITICNYESYQDKGDKIIDRQIDSKANTIVDSINEGHLDSLIDSITDGITYCNTTTCKQCNNGMVDSIVNGMVDSIVKINIRNKEYKEDSSIKSNQDLSLIDTNDFLKFFNAEMDKAGAIIPRLSTMTPQRERFLAARAREAGKEGLAEVVRKAAASDFLNGRNDRGWTADFAWMMRPNNFAKILEGNYDNDRQKHALGRGRGETRAASAKDYEGSF